MKKKIAQFRKYRFTDRIKLEQLETEREENSGRRLSFWIHL